MSSSMRVFTVERGTVTNGAQIEPLLLKGAGISIPAVIVGEEGRGRERAVVPVADAKMIPCPMRGQDLPYPTFQWGESHRAYCNRCGVECDASTPNQLGGWRIIHPADAGEVAGEPLLFAEVGRTRAGKPKFFAKEKATTDEHVIVVFRTPIGFRGGNSHTGDRIGWQCSRCGFSGTEPVEACPQCRATGWDGPQLRFESFPGEIIAKGRIAQGAAGRMGGGDQMIAIMPKGVVFRTGYSGRLYGAPSAHYYVWNGEKLLSATWKEREEADLF